MNRILKTVSFAAALGLTDASFTASAWWGGGPGSGMWDNWSDFFGDGMGDFNMSMSGSGHGSGRGYNRSRYGYGYGPYAGYGGGPWGYPGGYGMPYGGYGAPYGSGYPYAAGGYPGAGIVPAAVPAAPEPSTAP